MAEQPIFERGSIRRVYFSLAIPVVLSMVITILYNVTDTYFIAMTRNTDLVAGVSLCAPVFMLLMGLGNVFGQGGSSLISRLLGQRDGENLRRVSAFCFYEALLFGLVAGGLLLAFRGPVLRLLGADAATAPYASAYYTWFAAGSPVVVLSFIHSNLLRAEGFSRESMIGTVAGSLVNIALDPLFIFTFGMGAAGAAIATVLGYLCTVLYCLRVVRVKSRALSTDIRCRRVGRGFAVQIFAIGTSAALSNLTQSLCLILTNQALLPYGNDKIAAMGIVQKVSSIVMLVIVGFAFGGAPQIGYTYGTGDAGRLKALMRFVLAFLCGLALALSAVMIAAAPLAMRVFLRDSALVGTGVAMLRAQMLGMGFMAVVLFSTIFFQATGAAVPALMLSLSRQGFVFAAVLFIGIRLAGYDGILYCQAAADLLSAALAGLLFIKCPR